MPETLPRPLIALTVIVTVVAIYVGIKDYVGQNKKAGPPASTSTPTEVHSNARTRPRKATSAKAIRARTSASEANAPAPAQGAADDMEKALISEESAKAGAKAIVVMDNGPNTARAQSAHDGVEAAMDRSGRVSNEFDPSACLPLPNLTNPGDADTVYYENWAREYNCGL
jgi:hypothetical protein